MSYRWNMNAPEPNLDLRRPLSQPAGEDERMKRAPGGNDHTYDQ